MESERVIGIDIVEAEPRECSRLAAKYGVSAKCVFGTTVDEPADVVISVDAFEHFADPAAILVRSSANTEGRGSVMISFGCTWLIAGWTSFRLFRWAHLISRKNRSSGGVPI